MPLPLYVDSARWRQHLKTTWTDALVPVAKGNGYGFGRDRLLTEAGFLGATTVGVGTYDEVPVSPSTDVVVLSPWRSFLDVPSGGRIIHTISRISDLIAVPPGTRAVVEVQTSMRRHGIEIGHLVQLAALDVRATVLDVHVVRRGERVGYRQRRCPGDGHVIVVSGGTSHGIGLEAPTAAANVRQRAVSLAKGGLEAAGLALSPYKIEGQQRWFAEPPHMQASMLFLPSSVTPPDIGTEIPVDVRFTTTTFDHIALN